MYFLFLLLSFMFAEGIIQQTPVASNVRMLTFDAAFALFKSRKEQQKTNMFVVGGLGVEYECVTETHKIIHTLVRRVMGEG